MIRKLRFDCFTVVDAQGFSGLIWVLWKKSIGHVQVVFKSSQMISLVITDNRNSQWALSAVYASPTPSIREQFWQFLCEFRDFDL